MRGAFRRAGHPTTIRQGEVYYISDAYVHFPDLDPATRTPRPSRYALVLQGDQLPNGDRHPYNYRCPSVLVAPMSGQTASKRPWEYLLRSGLGGQSGDSLVKLHLAQPVPREALEQGQLTGEVPLETMQQILRLLLINLGVIAAPGGPAARPDSM